mmetsp:Transcript_43799/g.121180  ORF Transcript_43799/g.121180 Transcript_43799/m.121180 type:complete len:237 (+) Transcript_43799:451-1161(+)
MNAVAGCPTQRQPGSTCATRSPHPRRCRRNTRAPPAASAMAACAAPRARRRTRSRWCGRRRPRLPMARARAQDVRRQTWRKPTCRRWCRGSPNGSQRRTSAARIALYGTRAGPRRGTARAHICRRRCESPPREPREPPAATLAMSSKGRRRNRGPDARGQRRTSYPLRTAPQRKAVARSHGCCRGKQSDARATQASAKASVGAATIARPSSASRRRRAGRARVRPATTPCSSRRRA